MFSHLVEAPSSLFDNAMKDIFTIKLRKSTDKTLKGTLIYKLRKRKNSIPKFFVHAMSKKRFYPFGVEQL
ncbi:MAG: hypothetical protein ACMUJM_04935 [bacterium]